MNISNREQSRTWVRRNSRRLGAFAQQGDSGEPSRRRDACPQWHIRAVASPGNTVNRHHNAIGNLRNGKDSLRTKPHPETSASDSRGLDEQGPPSLPQEDRRPPDDLCRQQCAKEWIQPESSQTRAPNRIEITNTEKMLGTKTRIVDSIYRVAGLDQ